jgi:hypothetical protein
MPIVNCCAPHFGQLLSHLISSMFLVCKFHEPKRQQTETDKKRVTEKELTHLNHKIDKLLIKLEEENDRELAKSPDEECVICISAKATMQTFPCGHRVVCRKCFVKTIQMVVSQRMLPLRCVICRSKILRLKQTSHGGLNTGHVLRNSRSYANTNPFYISPASSPVSPVTEVFREQRAVFVRHFVEFGYDTNGQSPVMSPCETYSKSGGSNCVLHKHCADKSKVKSPEEESPSSPNTSSSSSSFSNRESSSQGNVCDNSSSFQWQCNRKRKYSRSLHRRHGTKPGRPNSLLLPIDESEELQELIQSTTTKDCGLSVEKESTSSTSSLTSSSIIEVEVTNNGNDETFRQSSKSSSLSISRFSITLMKAKGWIKRGKWSAK